VANRLRLGLAVLSATLAASLPSVISLNTLVILYSMVVALFHILIIGLPVFLVLSKRYQPTLVRAIFVGFLVGFLPAAALLSLAPLADEASIGGVVTTIDGERTLSRWLSVLGVAATLGGSGILGSAAFYYVFSKASSAWKNPVVIGLAALFLLLGIRQSVMLSSCHYRWLLEGGEQSPKMTFQLNINEKDLVKLDKILREFAKDQKWSARVDINPSFPGQTWFQYDVCTGDGVVIHGNFVFGRVYVSVYQWRGKLDWRQPYRDLYQRLEKAWPGKIEFSDKDAQIIPPPEWIAEADRKTS
jgi:hypothetical protein